ncbi:MAG: SUMF1/EgtB/PvdO family nonheme iron enzyme [Chloroflexota bacterium]
MNDYGSLRRRTRDAGWQWTLMGVLLGLGVAMVVCVGAYAVGAISLSAFDSEDEPDTVIVPNETEVAMQAGLQQTLIAQQATIEAQQALIASGLGAQTTEEATEAVSALDDGTGELAASNTPASAPAQLPGGEQAGAAQTPITAPEEQSGEAPAAAAQPEVTQPQVTPPQLTQPGETGGEGAVQAAGAGAENTPLPGDVAPLMAQGAGSGEGATSLTEETTLQGTPFTGLASPTPGLGSEIDARLRAIASELVAVNGGSFTMGTTTEEASQAVDECALYDKQCDILWTQDSTPAHQVTLDPYQIEITEVTTSQYVAFLNWMGPDSHKTGCLGQPCVNTSVEQPETSYINYDGEEYSVKNPQFYSNHPVTQVTWWGAEAYCNALGRRLPTEAEWEHAARGADNNYYPWGFTFDGTQAMSSIAEAPGTVPVTQFPGGASPYGALNMAGNVEEWVQDWYSATYYSELATNPTLALNPQGPISGTERVLRGGSWDTIPLFLRTMHRRSQPPGEPTAAIGFRCVSDTPGQSLSAPLAAPGGSGSDTVPSGAPTLPAGPGDSAAPVPTATLAPG